jgi:hypothetical protein
MYTQVWSKYLPILRILLKKSVAGEQLFNLNISDFEKLGAARKAGYKFNIHFSKGRVDNVISSSEMAKDLAATLLQDATIKDLFMANDYTISMNTKFQLTIKFIPRLSAEPVALVSDEQPA